MGLGRIAKDAHSRLPVYRDTLDEIIGFIHIKDVLPFWGAEKPFRLEDILRRVLFVAPSMRALDLSEGDQERTRLDIVKEVFADFVAGRGALRGRPDDAIGLVTFAGYADCRCR